MPNAELLYLLQGDPAELAETLRGMRPADIADLLGRLPPAGAAKVMAVLPFDLAVKVFDEPELGARSAAREAGPRHAPHAQAAAQVPAGFRRRNHDDGSHDGTR